MRRGRGAAGHKDGNHTYIMGALRGCSRRGLTERRGGCRRGAADGERFGLGGLSSRMLDWSVRVSGSPVRLGTQITADYPQMLASLAARRMAASQRRWGKNDLSVGVLAVVGLVSVYGKSDYFSDSVLAASVFAAGVFTNRSHSSLPCPKLIRSPTSLLAAFI